MMMIIMMIIMIIIIIKNNFDNNNNDNDTTIFYIFHFRQHSFHVSFVPHRVEAFTTLLLDVFGAESKHSVYGDFKLWTQDESFNKSDPPAYFIHVIQKSAETGNQRVEEYR